MILGLDTSGTTGGAALLDARQLVASVTFTSRSLYSQRLLPSIEWLLQQSGRTIAEVRAIAVAKGPGSFTGLRIGMSAAKAFAYANACPIVGVSTLQAIALRAAVAGNDMPVCALMDARQGMVYAGLYETAFPGIVELDGIKQCGLPQLEPLHPEFAGKLDEVTAWIDRPTIFAGEGVFRYLDELKARLGEKLVLAPSTRIVPSAEEVAWLGAQRIAAGEADDLVLLEPEYLRETYVKPNA